MKKTIKLQNLDCGNCAAKIENAIGKLEGVIGVKVNFMGQKMILEASDDRFNEILEEAKKIAKKIEPDIEVMA
ncbi:MAG: heavy metal-associated domain-containing protein [Thermotaleaceae bacterium]